MKNNFFVVFVTLIFSVAIFTSCSDEPETSSVTPPHK